MSLFKEVRDFLGGTISWPMDLIGGGLWGGVAPAASGAVVTEYTALQIAGYYACIRIISDQIASLPLLVMERQADGSEVPAWNHPYMNILHTQPNPEICGADFRQAGQGHLLMNGNCYIQIINNNGGNVAGLYLRSPFRTFPYRNAKTGALLYKTTDTLNAQEEILQPEEVIHVKGFSFDGLVGLSPVKVYAREVLGVDLAAQNYSAKFFANDSRPGGYLKSTTPMKDSVKLAAVQTWNAAHAQGSAHRMALLDGGLTWEAVGVTPNEAQFIETRQFNRSQLAAIFGVPGHMVGDDADAPRAVLEQKGVEFLLYTIKPWAKKWEQAINAKLFPNGGKYSAKFDTTELERPTYDVLLKGIQMARYTGAMSANEARKALKLNPRVKKDYESENPADALWMPVNMAPIKAEEPEPVAPPAPNNPKSEGGVGGTPQQPTAHSKIFAASWTDAVNRITARKNPAEKDFEKVFMPVLTSIAMSTRNEDVIPVSLVEFVRGYIKGIAHRFGADKFGSDELARAVDEINKKSSELEPEDEEDETGEQDEQQERIQIRERRNACRAQQRQK